MTEEEKRAKNRKKSLEYYYKNREHCLKVMAEYRQRQKNMTEEEKRNERLYYRLRREKNKEKLKQYHREYYQRNKERIKAYARAYYYKMKNQ